MTVRIATWNRAELLVERALASLRAQGYERWEAIVVGDACTDDTADRIARSATRASASSTCRCAAPIPTTRTSAGWWRASRP